MKNLFRPKTDPRARALSKLKKSLVRLALEGDREDFKWVERLFANLPDLRSA